MKKYLLALIVGTALVIPVTASATPPEGGPPGQGECEHGNSGQECRPDPQPEHGQDCEEHGPFEGGVNEDHCGPVPQPTPTPVDEPPVEEPPVEESPPAPPAPPTPPTPPEEPEFPEPPEAPEEPNPPEAPEDPELPQPPVVEQPEPEGETAPPLVIKRKAKAQPQVKPAAVEGEPLPFTDDAATLTPTTVALFATIGLSFVIAGLVLLRPAWREQLRRWFVRA